MHPKPLPHEPPHDGDDEDVYDDPAELGLTEEEAAGVDLALAQVARGERIPAAEVYARVPRRLASSRA
jgi:hypothetical protein